MKKESVHNTLDKIQIMLDNTIGYLIICNYINHPKKYSHFVKYKGSVDEVVLFHILKNSTHFRQYQYFVWKLFIIELSQILTGSTDKFSLVKILNKINNKCFIEENDFSNVAKMIKVFLSKNAELIKKITDLRSSKFAHNDFRDLDISIDFEESWMLIEEVKEIFQSFGEIFSCEYLFRGESDFLYRLDEIEAYYNSIVNSKELRTKAYLGSIVPEAYLININNK